MTRGILIAVVLIAAAGCKKEETRKETKTTTTARVAGVPSAVQHEVDPVRRAIFEERLDRLRMAIDAAKPDQEWVETEDGMYAGRAPDGEWMISTTPPHDRVRPDVLTPFEVMTQHGELAVAAQEDIRGSMRRCLGPNNAADAGAQWYAILHLRGDGETANVVDAEVEWPSSFTEDQKHCYLEQLRGKNWPSDHVGELKVEYPLCLRKEA